MRRLRDPQHQSQGRRVNTRSRSLRRICIWHPLTPPSRPAQNLARLADLEPERAVTQEPNHPYLVSHPVASPEVIRAFPGPKHDTTRRSAHLLDTVRYSASRSVCRRGAEHPGLCLRDHYRVFEPRIMVAFSSPQPERGNARAMQRRSCGASSGQSRPSVQALQPASSHFHTQAAAALVPL